jgi:hypothetical protein
VAPRHPSRFAGIRARAPNAMHRRRVSSSPWCEQPGARAAMVDPTAAKLPYAIPETTRTSAVRGHFLNGGWRPRSAPLPGSSYLKTPTGRNTRWRLASKTHGLPTAILGALRGAQGVRHAASAEQEKEQSARVCTERRPRDLSSSLGPIGGAGRLVQMIGRAAMVQATELALMAALAAGAPGRLVGGGSDSESGVLRSVASVTSGCF